ncbi:hypothetical protein B7463_g7438, partial [Scytalidium lignicola]
MSAFPPRSDEIYTQPEVAGSIDQVVHSISTATYAYLQSHNTINLQMQYGATPMQRFERSTTNLVLGNASKYTDSTYLCDFPFTDEQQSSQTPHEHLDIGYDSVKAIHHFAYLQDIGQDETNTPQGNNNYYNSFGNPYTTGIENVYHEDLVGIGTQFTE